MEPFLISGTLLSENSKPGPVEIRSRKRLAFILMGVAIMLAVTVGVVYYAVSFRESLPTPLQKTDYNMGLDTMETTTNSTINVTAKPAAVNFQEKHNRLIDLFSTIDAATDIIMTSTEKP